MARLDSRLEAIGAEFLVLGHLLAEGIQAYKAYTNYPGYDLIATNPQNNSSCRIQVKSRWATDHDSAFLISNFECDFVAVVFLNRGFVKKSKKNVEANGKRNPQIYVFPVAVARERVYEPSKWGKVRLAQIDDYEKYLENWELIRLFLQKNVRLT